MVERQLSHYEIVEPIGAGGMGEVYRARDTKLGRDVAIKVLPDAVAQDSERLARFEREARLLASLNHPNIATLHGLEQSGDTKFIVMELVDGETLAERIGHGPIAIEDAVALFAQIAEGLEAAHAKGIVHRDLKPANIKITPDGKVKILDFGLAKASTVETDRNVSESPTVTRGTADGVILGTAAYMSPEQARGKSVDKRTDIWAYGCCFYEALTGKTAFLGETVSDTIARILEREPNWDSLPKEVSPPLRTLLRRSLRKDAQRRLHDMGDVRIELEDAESARAPATAAEPASQMRRSLAAIAILGIGIAAGAALSSFIDSDLKDRGVVTRTSIRLGDGLAVDNVAPSVALSPDGRYVAYVTSRGLFLRDLGQLEAVPIESLGTPGLPFFSPDNSWLGFRDGRRLMKVSVSGGAPVEITSGVFNFRGASWSESDEIVYSPDSDVGLWRISSDGGEPEVLTVPDRTQREKTHRLPDVLPGGEAVLFTLGTADIGSFDEASIAALSLGTGSYHTVLEGGTHPRYSPTGHLIYARDGALYAVGFDTKALQVTGAPVPIAENVAMTPDEAQAEFALSRGGTLAYGEGGVFGRGYRVVWTDRKGETEPILEEPGGFSHPRLSPDGTRLALRREGANASVWVLDLDRSTFTRLTPSWNNVDPIWTPDSTRVTYRSSRDGPFDMYSQIADGSAEAKRLTTKANVQRPLSWSPDGKLLVFAELSDESGWDLLTLSLNGEPVTFLQTGADEHSATVSPDGRWVAYVSNESGRNEVYVTSFPGGEGKWAVSSNGAVGPRWNPRGGELFYRSGELMMVVDIATEGAIALGKPRALFVWRGWQLPDSFVAGGANFDVAPDGQRFAMIDDGTIKRPPTHLILVQNWAAELDDR